MTEPGNYQLRQATTDKSTGAVDWRATSVPSLPHGQALTGGDPVPLRAPACNESRWRKPLRRSRAIRTIAPIYLQTNSSIEAHILVAFLPYGLRITLTRALAWGLMAPRC